MHRRRDTAALPDARLGAEARPPSRRNGACNDARSVGGGAVDARAGALRRAPWVRCGLALAWLTAPGGCAPEDVYCECPFAGQTCCGEDAVCVDPQTNETSCGACGNACERGETCDQGRCRAVPVCRGAGVVACGFECVDTLVDPAHCGGCGRTCGEGGRCLDGACVRAGCPSPMPDLSSDPAHCGRCFQACRETEHCLDGACHCAADETRCDGRCVHLESDAEHCGACRAPCPRGASCLDGRCLCPEGRTACEGSCVDLGGDLAHCGACRNACPPDASCDDGACVCPAGLVLCPHRHCVDLSGDALDCGACGVACSADARCEEGVCVSDAPEPCLRVCDGACVSSGDDTRHCGACGLVAPEGARCDGGRVVCPAGTIDCDARWDALDCVADDEMRACHACGGCGAELCGEAGCTGLVPTALELTCGGPYRAGEPPARCRAYAVIPFPDGTRRRFEVTVSPFLRWAAGRCDGPACRPAGSADAPRLGEGAATWPGAGWLTPAGAEAPARVSAPVTLEVRARWQLGPLDLAGTIGVLTVPP